ncbi:type II toxin-antitoxin system ParD family antitoxin [Methylovulum psychrotolerans]|jgi:antitoxin ParD1/3/4|uniref:Antitoxin ParD n=1 Tax=Methylovulum psychrotolerans TaxID=1704499 RepID=A0A2S5CNE7_9GAMM|nr:type II toxin-antitoxin system ParD family antitoxin [Methylovulum psychrotolerans]POZ52314.1 type II toxin-antitoxin system ParD family antitoxin [Methylovulum psychrotolerans]
MQQKNTSVSIGTHFEQFIAKQIHDGRYGSASETIRAGLRLLEERELKLAALQKALIEGEASGRADYSLNSLIAELDEESSN